MKIGIPGTSFQRDTKNMALLQTNKREIEDYNQKSKTQKEINILKEEIQDMKSTLGEIKELLGKLIK